MIKDIDWINEQSPYPVKVENENLLSITTDTGKVIGAGFRRFFTIGSHMVLYFSFKMLSGERGGKTDLKLGATAPIIIKRYLMENPDNVLFFCHGDSDGTFALQRIFFHWYDVYLQKHVEDQGSLIKLSGTDLEGEKWHAGFFISKDCSERDDLIEALTEQKQIFFETFVKNLTEIREQLEEEYRKEHEDLDVKE